MALLAARAIESSHFSWKPSVCSRTVSIDPEQFRAVLAGGRRLTIVGDSSSKQMAVALSCALFNVIDLPSTYALATAGRHATHMFVLRGGGLVQYVFSDRLVDLYDPSQGLIRPSSKDSVRGGRRDESWLARLRMGDASATDVIVFNTGLRTTVALQPRSESHTTQPSHCHWRKAPLPTPSLSLTAHAMSHALPLLVPSLLTICAPPRTDWSRTDHIKLYGVAIRSVLGHLLAPREQSPDLKFDAFRGMVVYRSNYLPGCTEERHPTSPEWRRAQAAATFNWGRLDEFDRIWAEELSLARQLVASERRGIEVGKRTTGDKLVTAQPRARLHFLNVSQLTSARGDGHCEFCTTAPALMPTVPDGRATAGQTSTATSAVRDCLHYCLTGSGPVDTWNALLQEEVLSLLVSRQ